MYTDVQIIRKSIQLCTVFTALNDGHCVFTGDGCCFYGCRRGDGLFRIPPPCEEPYKYKVYLKILTIS